MKYGVLLENSQLETILGGVCTCPGNQIILPSGIYIGGDKGIIYPIDPVLPNPVLM